MEASAQQFAKSEIQRVASEIEEIQSKAAQMDPKMAELFDADEFGAKDVQILKSKMPKQFFTKEFKEIKDQVEEQIGWSLGSFQDPLKVAFEQLLSSKFNKYQKQFKNIELEIFWQFTKFFSFVVPLFAVLGAYGSWSSYQIVQMIVLSFGVHA